MGDAGYSRRSLDGTICALSTGALPSGVAIIRISGPETVSVAKALCGRLPSGRAAGLVTIRDRHDRVIDRGIALYFSGPRSFTGEDVLELQVHGGRAVVQAVLEAAVAVPGVRLAEAGEFTLRAFLNGRIDLTQAEALADLIAAETEAQRRAAVRSADGAQRLLYEGWHKSLLRARALIEAEIDFADEQETSAAAESVREDIRRLGGELEAHLSLAHRAEIIRDGFRVAIIGAPNAGKSSLLNALARRDVAIVTDEPGTTRDVLEVALDLAGQKVVLMDTAGIREATGRVERLGIERAQAAAAQADLVLETIDLSDPVHVKVGGFGSQRVLRIGTKRDLQQPTRGEFDATVSSVTGNGLAELLGLLHSEATAGAASGADVLPMRLRHVNNLRLCLDYLRQAEVVGAGDLEVSAEHLRAAAHALGAITGASGAEDLLDVIFGEFCLGK